ncbi:MAG: hypothetical protein R6V85_19475 [Polyangia bacterium]
MQKRLVIILWTTALLTSTGLAAAQEGDEEEPEASALDDPYATAEEEEPAAEEEEPAAEEEEPAAEEEEPAAEEEEEPAAEEEEEPAAEEEGEEEEGEEEEGEKPFRRTFAGTSLSWDNSFTARSLDKSYQYSYNPNYTMGFGLAPVWNISDEVSLSTSIGFDTELTNSDFSNKKRETFFRDIPINLGYTHSFDVNDDVKFRTGLNGGAVLPTSRMSRYTTMYTSLKLGTQATFSFPNVLEGLSLGWRPSFTKYFHESVTPRPDANPLDETPIPDTERATSTRYQALAYDAYAINPTFSVANTLSLNIGLVSTLSFSFAYTHNYIYKYDPSDIGGTEDGFCTDPQGCDDPRDTGHNERGIYSQSFSYMLSYGLPEPVQMLSLNLGAVTASNQLAPSGQYRKPFFNRETVITFGLSLDIDGAIRAAQGKDDEEDGQEEEEGEEE